MRKDIETNFIIMQITKQFIKESNKIEGIIRPPTNAEQREFNRFMDLPVVTIEDLEKFVKIYQPNAVLRDQIGLNVRVGNYIAPLGGPEIRTVLNSLLEDINHQQITPFIGHCRFETIHAFMDGNGRSGRMLWAWHMKQVFGEESLNLGFLHRFYYQTLQTFHDYDPS